MSKKTIEWTSEKFALVIARTREFLEQTLPLRNLTHGVSEWGMDVDFEPAERFLAERAARMHLYITWDLFFGSQVTVHVYPGTGETSVSWPGTTYNLEKGAATLVLYTQIVAWAQLLRQYLIELVERY